MTRLCARSLVVDQDLVDMEDMDRGLCTTAEEVGVVPLRQLPPLLLAEEQVDTAADLGITLRNPLLTTLLPW